MSATFSLIPATSLAPAPRYRERPRIDLASGTVIGQTIHLSAGVPADVALDMACRLASLVAMPVSVRVSTPLTVLPGLVAETLARTRLPPDRLEIAIAGLTLRHAAVDGLLALSALRDQGVDVALYHFGAPGTLDLVQHLPLSAVILEPSLIPGLPGRASATATVHTLLGIARRHSLRVVATGIEAECQRALLSGLGCLQGEGSLFGPPALHQDNLPKH